MSFSMPFFLYFFLSIVSSLSPLISLLSSFFLYCHIYHPASVFLASPHQTQPLAVHPPDRSGVSIIENTKLFSFSFHLLRKASQSGKNYLIMCLVCLYISLSLCMCMSTAVLYCYSTACLCGGRYEKGEPPEFLSIWLCEDKISRSSLSGSHVLSRLQADSWALLHFSTQSTGLVSDLLGHLWPRGLDDFSRTPKRN